MPRSEIDAFYDRIVRGLPDDKLNALADRAPANAVGQTDPGISEDEMDSLYRDMPSNPPVQSKLQATTSVEPSIITPIQKLNYPIAENYRQNMDDSLLRREATTRNLKAEIPDISERLSGSMGRAVKSAEALNAPFEAYVPDASLEKQISSAKDAASQPINTDRDLLTEAILSFGPALGGMILGENAQIGNVEVGQRARGLFEAQRKEKLDFLQKAKEEAAKRVDALEKLKISGREAFDKKQERELNRLKAIAESNIKFADMDTKQLNEAIKDYTEAEKGFSTAREAGAEKYANLAKVPEDLEAREKRAKILSNLAQQKMNIPTQGEREAAGFASMIKKANAELANIGGKDGSQFPSLKDPLFTAKVGVLSGETPGSSLMESFITDPAVRAQIQAEIDWAMTTLRDESGAAIGKSEAVKQLNRYFPRSGDDQALINQKAASRQQKENAVVGMAGRAPIPKVEAAQATVPKPKKELSPAPKPKTLEEKRAAVKKLLLKNM